jgi:hypothetical protein
MGERVFDIEAGKNCFTLRNRKTGKYATCSPQENGLGLKVNKEGDRYITNYRWYNIVNINQDMVTHCIDYDPLHPLPERIKKCPDFKRKAWNITRATKMVAKALTDEWRKLLSIEGFQKYILFDKKLAATCGTKDTFQGHEYYSNPKHDVWTNQYLYNDVMSYRPAMQLLKWGHYENEKWLTNTASYYRNESFTDWKQIFALDGKTYPALNKTLFNVRYSFPLYLLRQLSRIKLSHPIEKRSELQAYVFVAGLGEYNAAREDVKKIILGAKDKEIKQVAKYLREQHLQTKLTKTDGYSNLFSYLRDYTGETYNGSLLGLAKRSVAWHELERQNSLKKRLTVGGETPTAKPSFDYSKIAGCKHLDTVQAVADEGRVMGHCVASYAQSAVKGRCFLFHVEHPKTKEVATVEISPHCEIRQCQGPRNRKNTASEYAKRKFTKLFKEKRKENVNHNSGFNVDF